MTQSSPPPPYGSDPKAAARAEKAYAKATRPWFKKKRFIAPLAIVALFVVGGALGGGGEDDNSNVASDTSESDSATPSKSAKEGESAEGAESKPESKEAEATEEEPEPTAEPKPKATSVKAGVILKEFENNELAGDTKYKGKTLKITGVVEEIDTDLFDEDKYILRLASGGDFEFLTVNCHDMSTDELSTLSKGDRVTVLGEFDDGGDLGVEVKDCALA